MKYLRLVILCFVVLTASALALKAQVKTQAQVRITSIIQKNKTVELTVVSTQPFTIGANFHVLHIGVKDFDLSKQNNIKGKGYITFLIPEAEFNSIPDGMFAWLSYGDNYNNIDRQPDVQALCKSAPETCWIIGNLNKKMLRPYSAR